MKERIYTIPVNDAFNSDLGGCPLCALEQKTVSELLDYYLGASMMESDVRITTNEKGFCTGHLSDLYNKQENRLALGLMLHTHLQDVKKKIVPGLNKVANQNPEGGLLARRKDFKSNLIKLAKTIENRVDSCVLCDRLEYTMDRYVDVILWQFFEEEVFRRIFMERGGFCLPHTALLLRGCDKYLSSGKASIFVKSLAQIQSKYLDILEEDIEWFTLKFDYRNNDKPWKNSKDAIPRTIKTLQGAKSKVDN